MSEWIKHDGTGCPVGLDVPVNVKFRDGEPEDEPENPATAGYWTMVIDMWTWEDRGCDIVEYRVASP